MPDKSIFRAELVAALSGEGDTDQDGYGTGTELGEYLYKQVVHYSRCTQTPQHGKLRNRYLDKGDFVFKLPRSSVIDNVLSEAAPPAGITAEQTYWDVVVAGGYHPKDLQAFLRTYPDSAFAPEARLRLRQKQRQTATRVPPRYLPAC